ncbi:MAG TPA: carboxylesterase family protein [Opitutaceae bacterium]
MKSLLLLAALALPIGILRAATLAEGHATVANGVLQGKREASGVVSFKGIPFAAPPVGALRWREPQPAANWTGVRPALEFGPRAMQQALFSDMVFRGGAPSEDCLYLNVWTSARAASEKLPVLVYFYGGGFVAGDGSEPRYDGESMATKGIVAVTVNYRLGVFGFLAHPELTKESPHRASGNYGLLDQAAALRWVRANIAAFGGDPARVTIAGESAGSMSVSAQMASPLSRDLIAGAIGESGAVVGGTRPVILLAAAEQAGVTAAAKWGAGEAPTLAALRAIPADQLLQNAGRGGFGPIVDGYFFPKDPTAIYAAGEQARVPLLAGVNDAEQGGSFGPRDNPPPSLVEHFKGQLEAVFPGKVTEALKHYPASNDAEARLAARDLASDRFISYGTWKWIDLATKTGGKPTYSYYYTWGRPPTVTAAANATGAPAARPWAGHSVEIEYAMGNLATNRVYAWTDDDRRVSAVLQGYFVNFIKTGNPNGPGLPEWPTYASGQRQVIGLTAAPTSDAPWKARYEFFERARVQP